MDEDATPSPESNPARRPGDMPMGDAPPSRRARTASEMENDLARNDTEYRDRFRLVACDRVAATASAPRESTPEDIENACLNPMAG